MSRTSIVRLFWSSLAAFAGALVLFFVAVGLVYASGGFVLDGPDVVGVEPTAFGWSMIGVAAFTVLVMVLAALAQLIAWVAAVVDTAELPDKTWFIVLLVTAWSASASWR
jgi:divalent metal cation (Fe/Co/Zn/Cd) transporter